MLNLLVGVDGSETSAFALAWALEHAKVIDASVTVVTAAPRGALLDPTPNLAWIAPEHLQAEAAELQTKVVTQVVNPGVPITAVVVDGHPAKILCEYAAADLVVMGARGMGSVSGAMLGSVAHQVASHTERPLVIVRSAPTTMSRVMVAIDGSESALRAASLGVEIARAHEAAIEVVTVTPWATAPEALAAAAGIPISDFVEAHDEATRTRLKDFADHLGELGGMELTALHGAVAPRLAEHAKATDTDLLCVGTRGRGGFKRLLLGSVSHKLMADAHCPLLQVP